MHAWGRAAVLESWNWAAELEPAQPPAANTVTLRVTVLYIKRFAYAK